jgi:hypothetical protein
MVNIKHNKKYWSINIINITSTNFASFGGGFYNMNARFTGTRPIFNPLHILKIMDDANCAFIGHLGSPSMKPYMKLE